MAGTFWNPKCRHKFVKRLLRVSALLIEPFAQRFLPLPCFFLRFHFLSSQQACWACLRRNPYGSTCRTYWLAGLSFLTSQWCNFANRFEASRVAWALSVFPFHPVARRQMSRAPPPTRSVSFSPHLWDTNTSCRMSFLRKGFRTIKMSRRVSCESCLEVACSQALFRVRAWKVSASFARKSNFPEPKPLHCCMRARGQAASSLTLLKAWTCLWQGLTKAHTTKLLSYTLPKPPFLKQVGKHYSESNGKRLADILSKSGSRPSSFL